MGKKNKEEEVIDAHRRNNIDEYVDVIGNFTPSDLKNQKKKEIKKAVIKEVQGHKQIIQEAPENAVRKLLCCINAIIDCLKIMIS